MILDIKVTSNFDFIDDNFDYCRGIVLVGSTRSTKTISILQWIVKYCLTNKNKHIVIARDTLKNLKRTVLKDFEEICIDPDYGAMYPNIKLNKAELTCEIGTNFIEFIGLIDDPMRVHGLKTDIFYINEAIGTYKHTFTQLLQRNNEGFFLDLNPSEPNHWVYELEKREDVKFFRSTYQDNPFLRQEIIDEIEGYEPTPRNIEQGTADERMWSVYGKGLVYKGKEIIFPNWETYSEEPKGYDYCFFGLDWGFNHPLACTKVVINGNNLYCREVIYESELRDLDVVAERLKQEPLIRDQKTYVVCDESEPRSIATLIDKNIPAMAVRKKAGSVLAGIRKMQGYKIFVHEDSHGLRNEFSRYKWKVDPKTDAVTDVPVKEYDDGIDGIRYCLITFL